MNALLVRKMPFWKRCLDIFCALVGLTLLAPLFLVVAAAIESALPT